MKKFKSWFIVEEEDNKKANPKPKAKTPKKGVPLSKPATTAPKTAPSAPPPTARAGKVNDKFSKVLFKAMEEADQPGFDYLEFKKALENLKKVTPDEGTRYQSAYAMAQAMNVTPEQLINSAGHYLRALASEEEKFKSALQGQLQSQVANKKAQLPKLEQKVKELEMKIKELETQIANSRNQQIKIKSTIETAANKLNNTKADFQVTYRTITGQIEKDVANMKNYLK